jgi:hypothetical protein
MRAKIATKQATFALLRLHAELGGKIKDNKAEAERLAQCMKHVEAVLKMIKPGFDTRPIAVRRRKPNPWFKRGTVFRSAIEILRRAERPLSTQEITLRMLAAKGVENPSRNNIRLLFGGVQSSLRNNKGKSVVCHDQTRPALWSLAD